MIKLSLLMAQREFTWRAPNFSRHNSANFVFGSYLLGLLSLCMINICVENAVSIILEVLC